jgi:O-antigen/teichoic acid export membrane protein
MQQFKPLTLRRNFSWTFIGNIIYAGCQWGMLVVLAKLGSPEIVGQFTLGLAVTAPVVMLTNLQLRAIQATDAKHQYQFSDYLALRLIGTVLALLFIAGITFTAGYRPETSLVILTIGLSKAFESISDVFYGLLQQHERMDRVAISLMLRGPLSLLLLLIGFYLAGIVGATAGLTVAFALVLLWHDIRSGASILTVSSGKLQPRWHLKTLAKLVWLALPMGFVMMVLSLNTNIPRYFIERYLGDRYLGVYAAISYLMVAGSLVVNALGQSASPRLAKYYAAGDRAAFRTLLLKLVGIGALLGMAGILVALVAGRQILALLYQAEYAQYTDLFVWLMVAAGIAYISSFLGYGMTAARYFRIQMPLYALVTTTSAIACLWLIPSRGLAGAALAVIMAEIVQVGISLGVNLYAIHRATTGS